MITLILKAVSSPKSNLQVSIYDFHIYFVNSSTAGKNEDQSMVKPPHTLSDLFSFVLQSLLPLKKTRVVSRETCTEYAVLQFILICIILNFR